MSRITARLTAFSPAIRSLLRVVVALVYLEHGTMKLIGFPASGHPGPALLSLFGLAAVIETICGSLICLGFYTRLAAFVASGEMAAAYFIAHYPHSFFPAVSGGDAAVLFCFTFFYFVFAGPGPLSLDARAGRA